MKPAGRCWKRRVGRRVTLFFPPLSLQLEIKNHVFFSPINWDDLYHKRITPPFNPNVVSGYFCWYLLYSGTKGILSRCLMLTLSDAEVQVRNCKCSGDDSWKSSCVILSECKWLTAVCSVEMTVCLSAPWLRLVQLICDTLTQNSPKKRSPPPSPTRLT